MDAKPNCSRSDTGSTSPKGPSAVLRRRKTIDLLKQKLEKAGKRDAKRLRRLINRLVDEGVAEFNDRRQNVAQARRRANIERRAKRHAKILAQRNRERPVKPVFEPEEAA